MTDQQKKEFHLAADEQIAKYRQSPIANHVVVRIFEAGFNEVLNNPEKYGLVDINKIDFYAGELNKDRISAWRSEAKAWNIESSSVANIFCKGIDFVMKTLKGDK